MASTNNQTPIKDPTDTSIAEDMIFFLDKFNENFGSPNLFKLKRPPTKKKKKYYVSSGEQNEHRNKNV